MDELRDPPPVCSPWNLKLHTPNLLWNPLQSWVEERAVDLDYHVRRSALPSPGDERELGILVSRLHGHRVDLRRPPWEIHLIEGLERGRFAWYSKIHHSLVDGYSAMRIMTHALSTDPDERDRPLFFSIPQPRSPGPRARSPGTPSTSPARAASTSPSCSARCASSTAHPRP